MSFARRLFSCGLLPRLPAAAASSSSSITMFTSMRLCSATGTTATASTGKGNFFAFFDFPKQPALDTADLQKRYHALQRSVHPDRENVNAREQQEEQQRQAAAVAGFRDGCANAVAGAAAAEGSSVQPPTSAIDVSMYANAAYETLRDPFFRCKYLGRLRKAQEVKGGGAPVPLTPAEEEELLIDDDRRAMAERVARPNRPLAEGFLMEMLAMNELIFAGDREDANVRAQMEVLRADLKERDEQYFDDTAAAWESESWDDFYSAIEEWTYVRNALTHLSNRL